MEITRVVLGLVVALWLPLSLPDRGLRHSPVFRILWTVLYSAYVLIPLAGSWRGWVLWTATILASILHLTADRKKIGNNATKFAKDTWRRAVATAAILIAAVLFVLLIAQGWNTLAKVGEILTSDRAALVASGLLAAVFCGNDLVLLLVKTFIGLPEKDKTAPLEQALTSEYIGWLERAIVFAFIVGGQPSAAALAITAKSLARIPDPKAHEKNFIEYFLIGTLSSLLVALSIAVTVRIALGLPAL